MRLSDFDYELPEELIAQVPAPQRTASRLLVVAPDALEDRSFAELPGLLQPADLLVLNDTRVLKARLFGRKQSGGHIELLVERVSGERRAIAMLRASHPPRAGMVLELAGGVRAKVVDRRDAFYVLDFDQPVLDVLERIGRLPLPPYIRHEADAQDEDRYQTVYAREPGAVAAPTAGLHFDEALLQSVRDRGVAIAFVTLHVGAGTFQPVRDEDVSQHEMHFERYTIPESTAAAVAATRSRGGRIVSVGTTTLRALEASEGRAVSGDTNLFIVPGYEFKVVDALITNFHLPRSTLLMLVAAFAGFERIRAAYAHAIRQRYRFFSYGDAMLLHRAR
ncbi:MAG TPA: tRNA preQ1(34) S-adenosylmethionine ribosyltransferase-isomerase QueA [Burkholderiaceae bacterium]|nr:tRNA preQ1(34) S-adenosylmethionine ribosyltransferase-isomerase QueA [Burkholderiaceae bacterium]